MRIRGRVHRWAVLPALVVLGGCEVDWTELEDGLVVASVTLVLTQDPADSSWAGTDAMAILVRDSTEYSRVPGAAVRITGESGKSLQLLEVPLGGDEVPERHCGLPGGGNLLHGLGAIGLLRTPRRAVTENHHTGRRDPDRP